jgi:serine/threonine protein kinase
MKELAKGTEVTLLQGDKAKVLEELGRGGQGIVYKCEYKGQHYALKWYTQKCSELFYANLKRNIDNGPPSRSKAFLWPLMLTAQKGDSFGYLMQIRPDNFKSFGDILLAKSQYTSVNAMIQTALQACEAFYLLHLNGYSYQDLNDGNFFVDPRTGQVLICDNDNVAPEGQSLGVLGKMRYMAPEIVLGQKPNKHSDYYSLSVFLFLLFFRGHPLEGKRVLSAPCMTEKYERQFYGSEALFVYDRNSQENLPVRNVHQNIINFWPRYPQFFREAFVDGFAQNKLRKPTDRKIVSAWQSDLVKLRNHLIVHDNGHEGFLEDIGQARFALDIQSDGKIALSAGKNVYLGKSTQPIGVVRKHPNDPSLLALQNLTTENWLVETTTGGVRELAPKEWMPTKPGLKVTFPAGAKGNIV